MESRNKIFVPEQDFPFRSTTGIPGNEVWIWPLQTMELMWMVPNDLLPEYKPLLDDDFEKLRASNAADQAYWVAEMDVAIKAATYKHNRERSRRTCKRTPPVGLTRCNTTKNEDLSVDTEGSIIFWRRRKGSVLEILCPSRQQCAGNSE